MTSNANEMPENGYDVLILGGGPSGISAGMWADELGLSSAIVDRAMNIGGQLANVHNAIRNFPGAEYENGGELGIVLAGQIAKRSTELLVGNEVESVDLAKRELTFSNRKRVRGEALIVATGVRRRKLGVPGEDLFHLNGILASGAQNPSIAEGKTVAVIGGGDSALENALILSSHATRIFLVHRREEFTARSAFVDRVMADKKIELVLNSTVEEFTGSDSLGSMTIVDHHARSTRRIPIEQALIRIGYDPNSELFKGELKTDERGYLFVDRNGLTTSPHVYAIGDVCRPHSQSISSAIGDGATAIFSLVSGR